MEMSGFIVSMPDNWTKEDGDQARSHDLCRAKEGPETMPRGGVGREGPGRRCAWKEREKRGKGKAN